MQCPQFMKLFSEEQGDPESKANLFIIRERNAYKGSKILEE
jgi:hypothetical protein